MYTSNILQAPSNLRLHQIGKLYGMIQVLSFWFVISYSACANWAGDLLTTEVTCFLEEPNGKTHQYVSSPWVFDIFFVKSIIVAFLDWQFCQVCFLICSIIPRYIAGGHTKAMGTSFWTPCCFHELKLAVLEINEKGVAQGCTIVY